MNINVIEQKGDIIKRKKVAAYARVSTEKDEQSNSFQSQKTYYENYIKSNKNYDFVGIYADEGKSGTSISKRPEFKKMIQEAMNGKIDLIITKSISRFARNTVDSLTTIRKLKEKGVECYFEKENIYTFDSKGELLITIMSSIAQEESRSISENVTWGIRKRFEQGKYHLNFHELLGYKKGKNGNIEIDESQAIVVRDIYSMFQKGMTFYQIARKLTEMDISTPTGKKKWYYSVVRSILTNEKYVGDALLQKTYSTDFLNKKRKNNDGFLNQYYIKNGHPCIVDRNIFLNVQSIIEKQKRHS